MTFQVPRYVLVDAIIGVIAHLAPGNAVRSRRAGSGVDEEQPPCGRGFSMVGRQSVQVRPHPRISVVLSLTGPPNSMHCEYDFQASPC